MLRVLEYGSAHGETLLGSKNMDPPSRKKGAHIHVYQMHFTEATRYRLPKLNSGIIVSRKSHHGRGNSKNPSLYFRRTSRTVLRLKLSQEPGSWNSVFAEREPRWRHKRSQGSLSSAVCDWYSSTACWIGSRYSFFDTCREATNNLLCIWCRVRFKCKTFIWAHLEMDLDESYFKQIIGT